MDEFTACALFTLYRAANFELMIDPELWPCVNDSNNELDQDIVHLLCSMLFERARLGPNA